jgi:cytoskeletal protein RodZ
MALSMDEQRMLAEIERRLAAEDPGLATRLSSFRRPGPAAGLRSTRGRIIGSICTIVLLAVIGLTVYAMIPFRGNGSKSPSSTTSSARTANSAPARPGAKTGSTASGSTSASATANSAATSVHAPASVADAGAVAG